MVVLDIAASRDHRPTFLETIRRVAAELAIPLTAGGGVATVDEGRAILRAGADKLTVNTAALRRPALLTELAAEFGSQAVVLAIDAKRVGDHWEAFVRGGHDPTGMRRGRLGEGGRVARGGRDPADLDGSRRHAQRLRSRADRGRLDGGRRAGDRLGRRGHARRTFSDVFVEGRADAALAASIFHDAIQGLGELKRFLGQGFPCERSGAQRTA